MIHIVETFGDRFKLIPTYGVMEQISLRYAQYHGASDNMVEGETERLRIKATNGLQLRHQHPNGADRWGTGIKEMDSAEENYFNGDEDDDVSSEPLPLEESSQPRVFELKRRRSEDDEVDDELLQLSQNSPQNRGEFCPFLTD